MTVSCVCLSNFVGIRQKFLMEKFHYMYCIYFHIMLLLSYRICMYTPWQIRYFFVYKSALPHGRNSWKVRLSYE